MNSADFASRFRNKIKIIGREGVFHSELTNAVDKSDLPSFKIHQNASSSRMTPVDYHICESLKKNSDSSVRSSSSNKIYSSLRFKQNKSPLRNNVENILRSGSPTIVRQFTMNRENKVNESTHLQHPYLRVKTGVNYQVLKRMMMKKFNLRN